MVLTFEKSLGRIHEEQKRIMEDGKLSNVKNCEVLKKIERNELMLVLVHTLLGGVEQLLVNYQKNGGSGTCIGDKFMNILKKDLLVGEISVDQLAKRNSSSEDDVEKTKEQIYSYIKYVLVGK